MPHPVVSCTLLGWDVGKTMWHRQPREAAGAEFGEKSSLQEAENLLLGEVWGGSFLVWLWESQIRWAMGAMNLSFLGGFNECGCPSRGKT